MSRICHWVPAYHRMEDCRLRAQACLDCAAAIQAGNYYSAEWADSTDIARMRNAILESCRERNFDYLLMQDADVYSPSIVSPLEKMLTVQRETDAAMVAAVVGLRRIGDGSTVHANVYPFKGADTYDVEKAGTGMVLISLAHVNRIAQEYSGPWFARTYPDERQTQPGTGEDVFFSQLIRAHGMRVVACGQLPTVHVYRDDRHLHYDPRKAGIATAAEPEG